MQLQIYQRWKNVNEISVVSGVILLVYSTVSVTVPWEDFVTYLPPFPCKNQNDYSKGAYTHDRASLLYYYHYHYCYYFSKRIKYTDILINVDSWLNSREILKRFLSGFHFSRKENLQCRSEFFFFIYLLLFFYYCRQNGKQLALLNPRKIGILADINKFWRTHRSRSSTTKRSFHFSRRNERPLSNRYS